MDLKNASLVKEINYRVVVKPNSASCKRDADLEDAEELTEQIQKHCDFEKGEIFIEYDTVCVFCHREWDEDVMTGEPLCCRKASQAWEAKNSKGETK